MATSRSRATPSVSRCTRSVRPALCRWSCDKTGEDFQSGSTDAQAHLSKLGPQALAALDVAAAEVMPLVAHGLGSLLVHELCRLLIPAARTAATER